MPRQRSPASSAWSSRAGRQGADPAPGWTGSALSSCRWYSASRWSPAGWAAARATGSAPSCRGGAGIACRCALGLATPTAIMAGTGGRDTASHQGRRSARGRSRGDIVAFDKTGTLDGRRPSTGRPSRTAGPASPVTRCCASPPRRRRRASTAGARGAGAGAGERIAVPEARDAKALPGRGLEASVGGAALRARQLAAAARTVSSPVRWRAAAERLEGEGRTISWLVAGTATPPGCSACWRSATPRRGAPWGDRLHRLGVKTMCQPGRPGSASGGARARHRRGGEALARRQGRGRRRAAAGRGRRHGRRRHRRRSRARRRRRRHRDVSGTDVAMETAGITLMRDDPRLVANAASSVAPHLLEDQAEPRLGFRVQRARHPSRPSACAKHPVIAGAAMA